MTTALVPYVPPEWRDWHLGLGRCPYCTGLADIDYETCCDCWQYQREHATRREGPPVP